MDIAEALAKTAALQGLNDVQIAATIGVAQNTVTRWRTGETEPRGSQLMALRRAYPKFADLLDGKAAA